VDYYELQTNENSCTTKMQQSLKDIWQMADYTQQNTVNDKPKN